MKRFLILIVAALMSFPALAQKGPNDELGFHADKLYDFHNVDSVALFNGNLLLNLPIGNRYAISSTFGYQLVLSYNSFVIDVESWDCENPVTGQIERCEQTLPNLRSSAGLGWRLSLGRLLAPTEPSMDHNSLDRFDYVYEGPSGDEHQFDGGGDPEDVLLQRTGDASALRLIRVSGIIRDVEFPTGQVHRFQLINSVWRLTQMRDRFGNAVNVSYVYSSDGKRELQWTITDSIRTHNVYFDYYPSMADGWSRGQQVREISLQAFGGVTATWDFEYSTTTGIPLLTGITQPDGTEFQFEYTSPAGPLETIRFPTGGTVSYTYQHQFQFAAGNVCDNGPWGSEFTPGREAISTRTISDGATSREWKYVQRRGPQVAMTYNDPNPCQTGFPPFGPHYWSRTSVLAPLDAAGKRTRTDTYFGIFGGFDVFPLGQPVTPLACGLIGYGQYGTDGMPPPATAKGPVDIIPEQTANYPADVCASDGARALTSQTYAGCNAAGDCTSGTLLRSVYTRGSAFPIVSQPESVRTVFHDDTGCDSEDCYVTTTGSDHDGAGNYRTSTVESNFPGANTVTSYTATPTWTAADLSNSAKIWITNIFTEKTRTENSVTAYEKFCFGQTGLLLRNRVLAGSSEASNDIVNVYDHDDNGNVEFALSYGGDRQTISTDADLCTMPLPGSFWYKTENTYTNGVLATSRLYDRTSLQPLGFLSLDRTVDSWTGAVTEVRDSAGVTTSYDYSAKPVRLESMTAPGGTVTTYTYIPAIGSPGASFANAKVQTSTASDSGTLMSQFDFDGMGRVIRRSSLGPQGTWNATETAFDELGRAAWTSQPESTGANPPTGSLTAAFKTSHQYDPFGRLTKLTSPDGKETSVSYAGTRLATSTYTIAAGPVSETTVGKREETDHLGRLVALTENVDLNPSDGIQGEQTTSYTYDIGGRLSSVSMPGAAGTQTRTFTYDKRGFLLEEQHPEIGVDGDGTATYSNYDARGLAGKKVIGTTIDLRFDYDSVGRLIQTKDGKQSDRALQLFSWDCIRFEVTDPCTTVTHPGQLAASARYNYDSVLGAIAVTQANQYDPVTGHLVRRDIAAGNGVVGSETRFTGEDFFFAQSHTDLGLPDTLTYPCRSVSGVCLSSDPGRTIQHGYARGHLKSAGTWASNITYRPNGAIDTVTHGTGSSATLEKWEADPNSMARPKRIYSTNASGTQELWSSGDYEFDGSGNVKKIGNTSYFYDAFGRLNAWSIANPAGPNSGNSTISRQYDAFGNHLYSSESGCSPMPNPVCYTNSVLAREIQGTTNHYADTTYDGAGNVVLDTAQRAYTWDPLGMMTGATVNGRPFRFLYDANNERIAAVERVPVGATRRNRTTFTLRGDGNQLLSTWTDNWVSGSSVFTRKEDTIWRGSQVLARAVGTDTTNYTPDHLGSPRLITDGAGEVIDEQTFDPFGAGGLFGSGALQFTGHERDQANIGGGTYDLPDYMHARYYDKAGRFLSVDPKLGRATSSQSWNRYTYALNNPLRFFDPDGRAVVEFKIEHFIPTPYAIAPHGIYLGDGRGYSRAADRTFRTRQTIRIETDPNKSASGFLGASAATGGTANLLPLLIRKPPMLGHASASSLQTESLGRASDGTVMINATQDEELPSSASFGFGLAGTGIRSDLFMAIGTDGTVEGVGTRSGYPAMQISVSVDGGPEQLIYGAPALWDGLGIWSDENVHFKFIPAGACNGGPECR